MFERDSKGRVPYKECITFLGPGYLRDGEQHAAHPDVMGLLLRSRELHVRVELWLRASGEQCDSAGHSAFIPLGHVRTPDQLHPDARPGVDWSKV